MNGKTILVTGGAGYLGSHLVDLLLEKGYKVKVFDNLFFGSESIDIYKNNPNLQLFKGDIRHIEELAEALENVDSVIHLAGLVGDPACELNERETITTNRESTKVLIELCKLYSIEKFIFASSCSVYGYTEGIECNEGSITEPLSLYAKTKLDSENLLLKAMDNNFSPTILRMATLCGASKRMRFDLVLNIISAKAINENKIKINGGDQYRPLIHVKDAAKTFILALEAPKNLVKGQIFNVGINEQNFKIKELVQPIKECFPNVEVEYAPKEKDERSYKVSFEKIKRTLNFTPEETIISSIKGTHELFKNNKIKDYKDKKYYNVNYNYFMKL